MVNERQSEHCQHLQATPHILNPLQVQDDNAISAASINISIRLDMARREEDLRGECLIWPDHAKLRVRVLMDAGSSDNIISLSFCSRFGLQSRMTAELDRLQRVFKNKYNYRVQRGTIASNKHSTASIRQLGEPLNPGDRVNDLLIVCPDCHSFSGPRDYRNPACAFPTSISDGLLTYVQNGPRSSLVHARPTESTRPSNFAM